MRGIRNKTDDLLEMYDVEAFTGCWLWLGTVDTNGYGHCSLRGRRVSAHRLFFAQHKHPIPAGLCVCHTCDTPSCVNPDHLWLGTRGANNADMTRKGRHGRANARMTAKQVRVLRAIPQRLRPEQKTLAAIFAVSRSTISEILGGKRWRTKEAGWHADSSA